MKYLTVLIILAAILALHTVSADDNEPGSCLPTLKWTSNDAAYGYTSPVCAAILDSSQITHFWAKHADIPDGNPNGSCAQQTAYVYDSSVRQVGLAMGEDEPSPVCQQVIGLAMCLSQFNRCDPTIDGVDGNGYVTKEKHKPCKWLCELLHNDNSVCTIEDRAYLGLFGMVLDSDLSNTSLPQFNCNDSNYWSQDPDVCFAPSGLLDRKFAPRCEKYSGSACTAVFPSGSMIYLPPGVEQDEIEAELPFSQMFNALPLSDNSCASDWTRHQCQIVYQECSDTGLSLYPATLKDGLPIPGSVGVKMPHAFPLRTPTSTCTDYVGSCKPTRVFSTPSVAKLFAFPDCENSYDLHRNTCFPKGLTEKNAIDYVAPMMVAEQTYDPLNPKLVMEEQQETEIVKTDYTMAQIKVINKVITVYRLNAKAYLKDRDYDQITLIMPNTPVPAVFYGQTRTATNRPVEETSLPFPSSCPSPLVVPTHYFNANNQEHGASNIFGGRCALPCPSASYTHKERRLIDILSFIFVVGSMIFSGILLVSFLVFHSQRHKHLLIYYTLSYFLAMLFLFQGLLNRKVGQTSYNNQCQTNTHLWSMGGFGLYQAIFLVYFILASVCWWTLQATDLLERLVLGRQYKRGSRVEKRRAMISHIFCWGVPALCVVGIAVGGQFGYDGLLPFAWIAKDNTMTSQAIDLSWPFFFAPILVLIIIGLCCVFTVLFFFITYDDSSQGLKKFEEDVKKTTSHYYKLGQVLRLFGFVFLVLLFFILMIVHRIMVGVYQSQWLNDLTEWGQNVVLFSKIYNVDRVASRMEPGLIIMTVFALCSSGWISFILYFIASNDIIKLWCGLFYFKGGVQCCKRYAKEDTRTDGSTESSAGSSTHSTGNSSDILTGDIVLTKARNHSNIQENQEPAPDTSQPHSSSNAHKNEQKETKRSGHTNTITSTNNTNHSNHHQVSTATEQERRNLLFRGFKNTDVGAGSLRARSKSRDASLTPPMGPTPSPSHSGIELQTLDTSPLSNHPQHHNLSPVAE